MIMSSESPSNEQAFAFVDHDEQVAWDRYVTGILHAYVHLNDQGVQHAAEIADSLVLLRRARTPERMLPGAVASALLDLQDAVEGLTVTVDNGMDTGALETTLVETISSIMSDEVEARR